MNRLLAFFLLWLIALPAAAGDCALDGSVCLDNTPCKLIAGVNVCLTDIGATCWQYQDTYTCTKPQSLLQCQPFIDLMPDCWQTNSICSQNDPSSGACLTHDENWQCKDWTMATPPYVTKLADTITYVKNAINDTSCNAFGPSCTKTSETCTDGPSTKVISGISVYKDCWQWNRTYSCTSMNAANCSAVTTDPTCTLTATTCASLDAFGNCAQYDKSYTCSSGTVATGSTDCTSGAPPCSTTTTQLPPSSTVQGCQISMDPTPTTCSKVRNVVVNQSFVYQCFIDGTGDYCAPLVSAGCTQNATPVCTATDPATGACTSTTYTYLCGTQLSTLPTNVTYLNSVSTLVSDTVTDNCTSEAANQYCTLDSDTCIDGPSTKVINGLSVTETCWEWSDSYTCGVLNNSDCADLNSDPYCSLTSNTCVDTLTNGLCDLWDNKYTCTSATTPTQTVTSCNNQVTCINGFCYGSGSNPDPDFMTPVAWMEMARQAGQYQDKATLEIFKGAPSQCRVRTAGTCCKVTGAGQSTNSAVYGSTGYTSSITSNVARNAVQFVGSTYVYDSLFMSDLVPTGALNFAYGGGLGGTIGGASYAPNVSFYGLSVTYTNGSFAFGFDPYSFAIAVAIQVYQQVLSCQMNTDEGILSIRRGANLCEYVGTYCSAKVLGWCYEHKQAYCCFNSKLAKIINTQGRAQLGRTFGSPQAPDCSGFTPTELGSLDFATMDMSEFYAEIVPKNLDIVGTTAVVSDNVNCKTANGSYFGSTDPLCTSGATPGVILNTPIVRP